MDMHRIRCIAEAAVAAGATSVPAVADTIPGSVLIIDGDGLNYSCAGNDNTSQNWARTRVLDRIRGLKQVSGADTVEVQLTYPGSNKRMRYAIATVKPYQGKRHSHKPKNWGFLREFLQDGHADFHSQSWGDREADDAISYLAHSYQQAGRVVFIASEDKDMQMIPARHIHMENYSITSVPQDAWEVLANDKVYGRKWFYLQMLHGDSVDNIPGLPKYLNPNGKLALCGSKTAGKLLSGVTDPTTALVHVSSLYKGFYEDAWADAMVEQAALLWLSCDADAGQLVPPEFMCNSYLRDAVHRLAERVWQQG